MDRETLKKLPREEQNRFLQRYLSGGPLKDFSKEPVYLHMDDDTFEELSTGRIFQANELDLRRALVFE